MAAAVAAFAQKALWDAALVRLQPAVPTWVLIQFGHNDQPGKPGRSTDLQTEYPANLARYVDEVRAEGAVPVLVTPLTRRSFKGGELVDDLQPWAQAMRDVAQRQQVPLVDLYALSGATVRALGSAQADTLATAAPGQPGFDRTHLGARGACVFAEQLARELARVVPALDTPRSAGPDCAQLPAPSPPDAAADPGTAASVHADLRQRSAAPSLGKVAGQGSE